MTNVVDIAQKPIIIEMLHGQLMITSLQVAEHFEKNHKHVLRAIRELECSESFNRSNFGLIEYKDPNGRMYPMAVMTRDGFAFLSMGFTGPKAAAWKEAYINAFNAMESKLYGVMPPKPIRRVITERHQLGFVFPDPTGKKLIPWTYPAKLREANHRATEASAKDFFQDLVALAEHSPAAAEYSLSEALYAWANDPKSSRSNPIEFHFAREVAQAAVAHIVNSVLPTLPRPITRDIDDGSDADDEFHRKSALAQARRAISGQTSDSPKD